MTALFDKKSRLDLGRTPSLVAGGLHTYAAAVTAQGARDHALAGVCAED